MQKQKIAILGGGVSGVVAAAYAARAGATVRLIEARPKLGGLHRSFEHDGFAFDIGAFVFWESHELVAAFPKLRSLWSDVHIRNVRITPQGSFDRYPITLKCYLSDNGVVTTTIGIIDLLVCKVLQRKPKRMREYVTSHIGNSIYRRSGLATYIERLYGIPESEVALEFATQRLTAFQNHTVSALARKWFDQRIRKIPGPAGKRHIARPFAGFDLLYGAIQKELEESGVQIDLSCKPAQIAIGQSGFTVETNRSCEVYDAVVSTIPIASTFQLLNQQAAGTYEHADLISLFFKGRVVPKHGNVFYNYTPVGFWKRMTVLSRIYEQNMPMDYFTVEVTQRQPCRAVEEVTADFLEHASSLRLIEQATLLGNSFTPKAYPVFRFRNMDNIHADIRHLESLGIHLVGRQGRFEYLSSSAAGSQSRRLVDRNIKPDLGRKVTNELVP